jgi:hypothetical protein
MPSKLSAKWGVNVWFLYDGKTGLLCKFNIYTGKSKKLEHNAELLGEGAILKLLHGFEMKGHVIYCGNFFYSPTLFQKLETKGIGACGSVRARGKGLPTDTRLQACKMEIGDEPKF